MNARQFLDQYGREEAARVAEAAGTNAAYFDQLACCARGPSFGLAEKLVAASGQRLDLLSLMRAKAERKAKEAGEEHAA